ncbi:MAG: class I SAM-dependent methyltransferase [Verrucomicrobiales bacterium]|nr:class I SAM-dependent methyltransferase [Verrucomicrobiales bacterium]
MKPFSLKAKDHLHSGDAKKRFNLEHFAEAARCYDAATRCLSFGRDLSWKKKLVSMIPDSPGQMILDVACGTGDVSVLIAERFPESRVHGVDLTPEMISLAENRNTFGNVTFACGDMCSLELPVHSVDVITGSYALRNAPDLDVAISEFIRVLKPGGRMLFLDFTKPESKAAQRFQYIMLKIWGSFWGIIFHRNPEIHGYISESLLHYPPNRELEKKFSEHDLAIVESRKLFGGMMRLHVLELPSV